MNERMRRRKAGSNSAAATVLRRLLGVAKARARVPIWAIPLAIAAIAATSGSAEASGGVSAGDEIVAPPLGACARYDFGERSPRLGDCGGDVRTLNWLLRSKSFAKDVEPSKTFGPPTDAGVREFQGRRSLKASGVANAKTRARLLRSMDGDIASWYGPGLWGDSLACGGRLHKGTVGVAHRTLPCGTRVLFRLGDTFLRTRVVDRGPFVKGRTWDLTRAATRKLGLTGTAEIDAAVSRERPTQRSRSRVASAVSP